MRVSGGVKIVDAIVCAAPTSASASLAAITSRAPLHLKIPMMLARYVGYRVQSIARVQWSNYQDDPEYGKCFRMDHRKNEA
jgi:hypothetical protein